MVTAEGRMASQQTAASTTEIRRSSQACNRNTPTKIMSVCVFLRRAVMTHEKL